LRATEKAQASAKWRRGAAAHVCARSGTSLEVAAGSHQEREREGTEATRRRDRRADNN